MLFDLPLWSILLANDDGNAEDKRRVRRLDDMSEVAFRKSVEDGDPNFAILVLAIGEWVALPSFREWKGPTWALEACREYFTESGTNTRKISSKTKGSPGKPDDGRVLALIADLLIDPHVRRDCGLSDQYAELSTNQAIRVAIGKIRQISKTDVEQREINRLAYHWRIDKDRRLEHACKRRGDRVMAKTPFARR